jgi:hypothetical protein
LNTKLALVINNKTDSNYSSGDKSITGPSNPRVKVARNLLARAAALLGGLGSGYRDVSSLIEECNHMLGHEQCEPFCNLADRAR